MINITEFDQEKVRAALKRHNRGSDAAWNSIEFKVDEDSILFDDRLYDSWNSIGAALKVIMTLKRKEKGWEQSSKDGRVRGIGIRPA